MNAAGEAWTVEDLEVFKRAYALSLELHRASLDFPKIEQYGGLADQLRRASKSVCGLLAEGVGRQRANAVASSACCRD
jgi:four helix bundle protein